MDKQQIITFIEGQLATGKITKTDLLNLTNGGMPTSQSVSVEAKTQPVTSKEETSSNLTHIFYGIGAIIAIVGVCILVAQNWEEIGFGGRILVTLGIALLTYLGGMILRNPEQKVISQVMFVLSAVLSPLGAYVLLNEAKIDFSWSAQIWTAIVLFIIFGVALFVSKKNILVLLNVAFATWAYYSFIVKVLGNSYDADLFKWAGILLGTAYILIAYGSGSVWTASDEADAKEKKSITNVLYGLGTLFVLGAGITIGGFFNIVFIALIFGAFYGSVYLKSRAMLILGGLFLMAHIIKLTSEYFADTIGWPVALIIVGFLVIGVGYMTYQINKKFIRGQ